MMRANISIEKPNTDAETMKPNAFGKLPPPWTKTIVV